MNDFRRLPYPRGNALATTWSQLARSFPWLYPVCSGSFLDNGCLSFCYRATAELVLLVGYEFLVMFGAICRMLIAGCPKTISKIS